MRTLIFLFALTSTAYAQYPPQVGIAGSTAIPAASPLIQSWATGCSAQRGLRDIAKPDSGYASAGLATDATGASNGSIVSLGDSGVALLTFSQPIGNGPGPDFAVFENGFPNPLNSEEAFLELAFVEVSSDGVTFVRFPARSRTAAAPQLSSVAGAGYINARAIHNLAGKYTAGNGTPFDLSDLIGTPGLDLTRISHVRVVDVVGSVGTHGSLDDSGAVVNDPYPTIFPTGGFDLDAVAVLNTALSVTTASSENKGPVLFPNPTAGTAWLHVADDEHEVTVANALGAILLRKSISGTTIQLHLGFMPAGVYRVSVHSKKGSQWSGNLFRR